ncbi:pirin family protein [Niastella populi]|uniref:Pirin-like protein n=1 Tax=Niastella populi TaxID=550983 RepID=A0A1V9FVC5_9BACT|nr:pirin family protein [Niastella populi]OQP62267.1 Pirin-like protein [Niastella populi]
MKKQIVFSSKGRRADIGDMIVYRILPNRYAGAVGPFVFLDYLAPQSGNQTGKETGTGAHPHRGIATLSYILHGEDHHFDSAGNVAKVNSGGIQWMKAGNGIIHDETLVPDPNNGIDLTQGFQFWINLPGKNKTETPGYMAIQAADVPQKPLAQEAGYIKVIAGSYEELHSKIPAYTEQFLYHIHLKPGSQFTMNTNEEHEYGIFVPETEVLINEMYTGEVESVYFGRDNGTIEIYNVNEAAADMLVFGGAPYTEPIIAEGPFVMNTHEQIAEAYHDFHSGKYGQINYNQ